MFQRLALLVFNLCNLVFIVYASSQKLICRIGTRPSPLAKIQAQAVAEVLKTANSPDFEFSIQEISASGDIPPSQKGVFQNQPLALQPADFTGALDQALLNGGIDVAVHSFKDVPPTHRWYSEFSWACPLPRKDPADVLVGSSSLESLFLTSSNVDKETIKIGTASIRRQAQLNYQLLQLRNSSKTNTKHVKLVNLRGNLQSRLHMLHDGEVDALILAKAGLERLGNLGTEQIAELPSDVLLPGLCQGIVAAAFIEHSFPFVMPTDHDATIAANAEREFLNALDEASPWTGRPPVAGLMQRSSLGEWDFQGLLARPDGTKILKTRGSLRPEATHSDAKGLGKRLGLELRELTGSNFFGKQIH